MSCLSMQILSNSRKFGQNWPNHKPFEAMLLKIAFWYVKYRHSGDAQYQILAEDLPALPSIDFIPLTVSKIWPSEEKKGDIPKLLSGL